jgi:hypothetical protein
MWQSVDTKRTFQLWSIAGALTAFACGQEATLPGANGDADAGRKPAHGEDEPTTKPRVDFLVPDAKSTVELTQVYSGQTHDVGDVQATLRAQSDEIEVYVDDSFWGTQITGPELNAFMHRLVDEGAPESYRPDLGVLATNELVFGTLRREKLPDGKQRVFIVNTVGAGDGYLCGWCTYPDLHLDGTLVSPLDGDIGASIAAHELLHGIHRGYDADEEVWLDETLAEAAMSVNGLFTDEAWLDNYLGEPNMEWQGRSVASVHYGACLAWGSYLWEQGGPKLMRALTAEPMNGWASIDAALVTVGERRSAWELFLGMGAALHYDAPERGLGFESFDVARAVPARALAPGSSHTVLVEPFGLVYFVLNSAGTLVVEDESVGSVRVGFVMDDAELELRMLNVNAQAELPAGLVVVSADAATRVNVSLN